MSVTSRHLFRQLSDLTNRILPQLELQPLGIREFWLPLLRMLYENRWEIPFSSNPQATYDFMTLGLERVVAVMDHFPIMKGKGDTEDAFVDKK